MSRSTEKLFSDILVAIQRCRKYCQRLPSSDLEETQVVMDGLVLNLVVIGEAAGKIPEAAKRATPDIQWRQITDMRNRLIHAYHSIDYEKVLQVVREELDPLEDAIRGTIVEITDTDRLEPTEAAIDWDDEPNSGWSPDPDYGPSF